MRSDSRISLSLSLSLVGLLLVGCQGGTEAQPGTGPEARSSSARPAAQANEPKAQGAAHDDPLGQRFADPAWFRSDMLAGAELVTFSRSQADENGFFASHILLALPEGTTAEQCADLVTAKVEPSVPGLQRAIEGDRISITGTTDRYRVVLMCGEAKGVMRAYVSLEWFA